MSDSDDPQAQGVAQTASGGEETPQRQGTEPVVNVDPGERVQLQGVEPVASADAADRIAQVAAEVHDPVEFILLNDEPDAARLDPLGFEQVAANLAGTILRSRRSSPLTLGIEGGWGTGKSTLMRRLARRLDLDAGVTVVWFNAWAAEGNSALEGLIKTVLQEISPRTVRQAARRERVLTAGRAGSTLLSRALGLSQVVDVVWEQVSKDARARNNLRDLLHRAMGQWGAKRLRRGLDPLMVVFVDDLDRASPDQIFEVLEAVKLYLDTRGIAFVVGYDQSVISEVVLAEKKYSANVTGRQYLEKIVQVAYRINPPDDDHAMALAQAYTDGSGTAALFDEAALRLMIDRNQRNPRRIKRFLNSFVLLYGLDAEWRRLGPKALLDVLLLDTHFPEFMALFRAGTDADPVTEFLGYVLHRQEIEQQEGLDPEVAQVQLRELERRLPEQYPVLVRNDEFVTLVSALHQADEWDTVRLKLQRRRALVVELPSKGDDAAQKASDSSAGPGGRILWIVTPGGVGPPAELTRQLVRDDWDWLVQEVHGPASAWASGLSVDDIDVIVIQSDGRPDQDLDSFIYGLRAHTPGFGGPVIVFVSRLTPEMRTALESVDAAVTNHPAEVGRYLTRLSRYGRRTIPPAPRTRDDAPKRLPAGS